MMRYTRFFFPRHLKRLCLNECGGGGLVEKKFRFGYTVFRAIRMHRKTRARTRKK